MPRPIVPVLILLTACCLAFQRPPAPADPGRVADPFAAGWMLTDTNGDGIADFIAGKIVVTAQPNAAENSAAANLAARLGFGSTGLTPPLVVDSAAAYPAGPRIWVGRAAPADLASLQAGLEKDEGGVFLNRDNLAIVANDDAGLLAASEAYAARAPYQWRVPGEKLSAIVEVLRSAAPAEPVELAGVTYLHGKAGVHRAFLRGAVPEATLATALASPRLAAVHQLVVIGGPTAVNTKAEAAVPPAAPAAAGGGNAAGGEAAAAAARLDLATLYTTRGLFGASGRIPVPATWNGHLYVPAGAAGIAMANLAARLGLETTGINLPLATPADSAAVRDVRAHAVLAGDSPLSREAEQKLRAGDTAAAG
jgi:hypothetical protein